jgi:hypothetical protein
MLLEIYCLFAIVAELNQHQLEIFGSLLISLVRTQAASQLLVEI